MENQNIEYCLMAIYVNFPEHFERAKKNGNIFLNSKAKDLFDILFKTKNYNSQVLMSMLQKDKSFEIVDFLEIKNYYYEVEQYQNYYDYVLKQYIKYKIYQKSVMLLKDSDLSSIEIKQEILNIINEVSLDEENEISMASEILFEMINSENQICELVKANINYIDEYGGFECDDYIIYAARPSEFKTTKVNNLILRDIRDNLKVGFFSIETSKKKIMSMISCSMAGIQEKLYRTNMLKESEKIKLYNSFEKLYEKNICIDDTSCLDIEQLKRKARIMKSKFHVQKIYVDYLQIIQCHDRRYKSRYEQITFISNSIKILARELKIPIVMLCQLNRESENSNREPRKSDLKDSGAIEQDANIIILHYVKPEEKGQQNLKLKNIVAKFKNGATGYFFEDVMADIGRISEYTQSNL